MKIQELLSSEDKWTQKAYATDKNDEPISANSSNAVKWCLLGAIIKCYPSERYVIRDKIINTIKGSVVAFNDTRSYEEVMELVKRLDI